MTDFWDKPSPLHQIAEEIYVAARFRGTWRLSRDQWINLRVEPASLTSISFVGPDKSITFMGLPIVIAPGQDIMEIVDG